MQALLLDDGQINLRHDYPVPQPQAGEALLRMRLAGICGTDLALARGYKGGVRLILGHEYVADVVSAPGNEAWEGKRVVGEINTTCGQCSRCRRGLRTHCARRRVLGILDWDGVFAEYFISPVANLYAVPEQVSDEQAVFTEPLAAAYAVLRDMPADAGERIVVFGDGRLGQLIARVLQAAGYRPLLVGRHAAKLQVAAAAGIRTRFLPRATRLDDEGEWDVAVDATGSAAAIADILACLRPRGVLILKTTSDQPVHFDMAPVVVNELRIIGSRCGPFDQALAALASGTVDPRPLISARYPLAQAEAALQSASDPAMIKVLITGRQG